MDASYYSKSGAKMFDLMDIMVQKIGSHRVVQIVIDCASNNVMALKLLEAKYPHLYWTSCVAHCLDLMLEDMFKIKKLAIPL